MNRGDKRLALIRQGEAELKRLNEKLTKLYEMTPRPTAEINDVIAAIEKYTLGVRQLKSLK